MRPSYLEAENPNAATPFPYCVRETLYGKAAPTDPGFHVMHWHDDLQFLYVADGTIEIQTLEDRLTVPQGEGAFLSKGVVHCIHSTEADHYYNLLYPADELRFLPGLPGLPANDDIARVLDGTSLPLCPLTQKTAWERHAIHLLQELAAFAAQPPDFYDYRVLLHLFELVLLLRAHAPLAPTKKEEDANALRTKQILHYIAAHYAEDVTLDDLAASAHCSKSACLRAFRACMATTPYNYLIEYRLEQAALRLRQTDDPVAAIAEAVGFHHFSLFGKSFKAKTGQTPKAYRMTNAAPRRKVASDTAAEITPAQNGIHQTPVRPSIGTRSASAASGATRVPRSERASETPGISSAVK